MWVTVGDGGGFVEFGVLGPFRLWREGAAFEVAAARHRVLLAALVVHANEGPTWST